MVCCRNCNGALVVSPSFIVVEHHLAAITGFLLEHTYNMFGHLLFGWTFFPVALLLTM